jgi:hypothetical protein
MAQQPLVGQGHLIIEASRSHSVQHTTLGRTSLDKWSALRRELYLTTHNTHNRQTSIPPAGFEPTIPVSERLQTHAIDRADTGIGCNNNNNNNNNNTVKECWTFWRHFPRPCYMATQKHMHAIGMFQSHNHTGVPAPSETLWVSECTFDLEFCTPSNRTNRKPQLFQVSFTAGCLWARKNVRGNKWKNQSFDILTAHHSFIHAVGYVTSLPLK